MRARGYPALVIPPSLLPSLPPSLPPSLTRHSESARRKVSEARGRPVLESATRKQGIGAESALLQNVWTSPDSCNIFPQRAFRVFTLPVRSRIGSRFRVRVTDPHSEVARTPHGPTRSLSGGTASRVIEDGHLALVTIGT